MLSSQTKQYTKISSKKITKTSKLQYSINSIIQSPNKKKYQNKHTQKSQTQLSPYTKKLSINLKTNLINISTPNNNKILPHISFISNLKIQLSNFLNQPNHHTNTSSFPQTLHFHKIFSILQITYTSFITF